jgi:hypothetical protein
MKDIVRRLGQRLMDEYRDPDPKEARLAAGRGAHRALAERMASGSGLTV